MRTFKYIAIAAVIASVGGYWISIADGHSSSGYDLMSPDHRFVLPDALREISGLIHVDADTLTCVQDEHGILFHFDPLAKQVAEQQAFGEPGDYEGITRVGDTVYVLRSDGNLFEIVDADSESPVVNFIETGIPGKDNEGLCYDAAHARLLIGTKGKSGIEGADKDLRVVHSFDLSSRTIDDEPAFVFNLQDIRRLAAEKGVELHPKTTKKGKTKTPEIKLMTSAICIHPITGKLFMLSADDHLLCVIDRSGKIEHLEALAPELFNKAEGLTFDSDGDLFVSNEGEDKQATILRFDYREGTDK